MDERLVEANRRLGAELVERLRGVEIEDPLVDRGRAEEALGAYLERLELEAQSVCWLPGLEALRVASVPPNEPRTRWKQLVGLFSPAPPPWVTTRVGRADDAVVKAVLGDLRVTGAVHAFLPDLEFASELLRWAGGVGRSGLVTAVEPLLAAAEAGVLTYCFSRDRELVAVPRPKLRFDERGRLHALGGLPAISWPGGGGVYFWHGLCMDAAGRDTVRADADVVQEDDFGRLWRSEQPLDGEPAYVVEVVDATQEADGTRRRFFLRVPPTVRTAHEAVAWTFGFPDPSEYEPGQET